MLLGKMLTGDAITVLLSTRSAPFVMNREHKLFQKLLDAVQSKDIDGINEVIHLADQIHTFSQGKVTVRNGVVYYNNEVIHSAVSDRILDLMALGQDFTFMSRFLENLMLNPSFTSRQELYLFLENGNMPITDDGRFLAYKWVRENYRDCHSNSMDNSVGQIVKMDRTQVDDNRQNTCSYGLHVCTHGYTQFGPKLMLVAVNPKDVVSVPYDYANAKMRVAEYEVLKELDPKDYVKFQQAFVFNQQEEEPEDEEEDDDSDCTGILGYLFGRGCNC